MIAPAGIHSNVEPDYKIRGFSFLYIDTDV